MKRSTVGMLLIGVLMLVSILSLAAPTIAQSGPDAWTAYQLTMRSGPASDYAVVTVLPANTALNVEAHNADLSWLLVHTQDGSARGWVACDYLSYADGFSATRLPASEEIVAAGAPSPVDTAAEAPAGGANGSIDSMTMIYSSPNADYFRLTYWSDGLRINGFIGIPHAAASERRPAIIYNRGGAWDTGALIGIEIVPFAESGFVAAASQYRGNGGSEGSETFGGGDVNDVLNLITLVQGLPEVDPARIGMMGGSRGGMVTYMALRAEMLSGRNRVKAAVTVGGISNMLAMADQRKDWIDALFVPLIGARPSENYNAYVDRSAVYWPGQINTPLLLLHGEADAEVSVDQSRALYNALLNAGKTVQLVTIPNGDHPLSSELGGYPAAVDWFASYLRLNANYSANWSTINGTTQWFYANRP